jgi:hypothetical protein
MPPSPPRFAPRTRPRAADLNRLAQLVERLSSLKVGRGLQLIDAPGGLLLALSADTEFVRRARITAAPAPGVPILPSACRYSAASLDGQVRLESVLPVYGRQVEADECAVYPGQVDDLCALLMDPRPDGAIVPRLWIFRENVARVACPA